jgi:acetolactate synthase-1/2/3 large subunit
MKASDLFPMVPQRIVLDCPVDYAENMKLTEKLGNLVCPI